MPKAKIEPENNNSHELDPIIDALLIHLPAPGDYFAKDDRKKWLQMMELSFGAKGRLVRRRSCDHPLTYVNGRRRCLICKRAKDRLRYEASRA